MTAPGSFAVGNVLTAADMNEFGAWTTYTPTIGGVTTSSITGKWYKLQKIGFCFVSFTMSAAPTAAVTISWPSGFTPANTAGQDPKCVANYFDTSATDYYAIYVRATATNWRPCYINNAVVPAAGTSMKLTDITNTLYPVLPANGDVISFTWVGEVT